MDGKALIIKHDITDNEDNIQDSESGALEFGQLKSDVFGKTQWLAKMLFIGQ